VEVRGSTPLASTIELSSIIDTLSVSSLADFKKLLINNKNMSENFLKKFFEKNEPEGDPSVNKYISKFTDALEGGKEEKEKPNENNKNGDEIIENYGKMNLDRPEE
jgi:hypothetical protein